MKESVKNAQISHCSIEKKTKSKEVEMTSEKEIGGYSLVFSVSWGGLVLS